MSDKIGKVSVGHLVLGNLVKALMSVILVTGGTPVSILGSG
jgi:hypothetical protein